MGNKYKLLLVDDERSIREGIHCMIDWEGMEISVQEAKNGLEAYDIISRETPDIVMTDIKMPGMDGLELIEKTKQEFPDIFFIILSGYSEFSYASKAMKHEVKYYLLKPIDENEIIQVVEKVIAEIEQKKDRQEFVRSIQLSLERLLPQVKEQFFRDCIMSKIYTESEIKYYKELFKITGEKLKLVLFQLEGRFDFEEIFALKSIIEKTIENRIFFSTVIRNQVLLATGDIKDNELIEYINNIKSTFNHYYNLDITVSISESGDFNKISMLYKEVLECLEYRFYTGEGSIITINDMAKETEVENINLTFNYDKIALIAKSGNFNEVKAEIDNFFNILTTVKCDMNLAKTFCVELFMAIIRQGSLKQMDCYIKNIVLFQQMDTLEQMYNYVVNVAGEVTHAHYEATSKKYSALVNKIIECINQHIGDEELSLSFIANRILYMNMNYLGKLFKKETNESFSYYVMKVRMEKAKQMLESSRDYKIYEISQAVGFGDNSQYLSQVFKKYTGYTPTDYKKRYGDI